jgi:hypothetical protein
LVNKNISIGSSQFLFPFINFGLNLKFQKLVKSICKIWQRAEYEIFKMYGMLGQKKGNLKNK